MINVSLVTQRHACLRIMAALRYVMYVRMLWTSVGRVTYPRSFERKNPERKQHVR